jgi:hypothetical protein
VNAGCSPTRIFPAHPAGSDRESREKQRVVPLGRAAPARSRTNKSRRDARQAPSRVERWPAPSSSRSTRETARPRGGGRRESTWDVFLRNAAARRFGGVKPSSPAGGQRANGRSKTKWRNVSRKEMSIGGENYDCSIIPVRSDISRFSRGTECQSLSHCSRRGKHCLRARVVSEKPKPTGNDGKGKGEVGRNPDSIRNVRE